MSNTKPSIDIEHELRNLNALLEVSKALSSEIQLDNLLQVIVQKTTEVMDADLSSLFLYDAGRNELWSKIAQKLGQLQEIRLPVGVGIAGDVAKTRQGANIADAYVDPRFNPDFDRQTGYRTCSILCLPMLSSKGKLVGVIQVLNKKSGGVFDERDESLLAALAAHAAVALGVLEDVTYRAKKRILRAGDGLFLYTDGVTEATDRAGNFFSDRRLQEFLQRAHGSSPTELIRSVVNEVKRFSCGAEQSDDITTLAIQYLQR